jgi:hypothetical protein
MSADQNTAPATQEITVSELLSALETQEREAVIGHRVVAHFGQFGYKPCNYNSERIARYLKENGKVFTFDDCVEAITTLSAQCELLPPPPRPVEPEAPKVDNMGLTYDGLLKMSRAAYKAAYSDSAKRVVIDRLLQEEREKRGQQ